MAEDNESQQPVEIGRGVPSRENADGVQPWSPTRREWFLITSLGIVCFVVALDGTIVPPSLPTIQQSLGGNTTSTFWIGTSYLLAYAVFQPFFVQLSSTFGRQRLLFIAITLFTAGTALCCSAHGHVQLLSGRVCQGIGAGGISPLANVIMTDIVPLRQRPKYYSILQLIWILGSILGPLFGGLIVQYTTWRWIFYINLPFCSLGLILIPLVMRRGGVVGFAKGDGRLDWIGGLLLTGGVCAFLFGITCGGSEYPWNSLQILLPIALGVAVVCLSFLWQSFVPRVPFIDLKSFMNWSSMAAYTCVLLQGFLLAGQLYYIPLFFVTVKDFTAIASGATVTLVLVCAVPINILTSLLLTKLGQFRWAIRTGWAATILCTGLLLLLDEGKAGRGWIGILIAVGIGHGILLVPLLTYVQASVDGELAAQATGMYTFMRSLGMCVGVAVGSTVFQNGLQRSLSEAGLQIPEQVSLSFVSQAEQLTDGSLSTIQQAYYSALRDVFVLLTGIAGLGGVAALVLQERTIKDRK